MRADREPKNILSLETAVSGGSVALIIERTGFIFKREGAECSRAEKLIPVIDGILDEAGVTRNELDMVAISTGPGSYSGIRIGLATALGLANALGIACTGVSVLEAMAYAIAVRGSAAVAIPVGKTDIAWQIFGSHTNGSREANIPPELTSGKSFIEKMTGLSEITLFAHSDLLPGIAQKISVTTNLVDAGSCLAEFVGKLALRRDGPAPLKPLYLRNKDAAVRPKAF